LYDEEAILLVLHHLLLRCGKIGGIYIFDGFPENPSFDKGFGYLSMSCKDFCFPFALFSSWGIRSNVRMEGLWVF